jgi:hypothetical protein
VAPAGFPSYLWQGPSGFSSTNAVLNTSVTGTYSLTLGQGNCLSNPKIVHLQYTPASVSLSSDHPQLCPGDSAILSAAGALSYTWNTSANSSSIAVNPTITTSYSVTAKNQGGCTATATITQQVYPPANVKIVRSDSIICSGESLTLTASGLQNYSWNGIYFTPQIIVQPQASSVYSLQGFDANNCASATTVQVAVQACAGIKSPEEINVSARLFPNPNSGEFTVVLTHILQDGVITIYNLNGEPVYRQRIAGIKHTIISEATSPGMYSYIITDKNHIVSSGKFRVQ